MKILQTTDQYAGRVIKSLFNSMGYEFNLSYQIEKGTDFTDVTLNCIVASQKNKEKAVTLCGWGFSELSDHFVLDG